MKRTVVLMVLAVLCIGAAVETITRQEFDELKAEVIRQGVRISTLEGPVKKQVPENRPELKQTVLSREDREKQEQQARNARSVAKKEARKSYEQWFAQQPKGAAYKCVMEDISGFQRNEKGDYLFKFIFVLKQHPSEFHRGVGGGWRLSKTSKIVKTHTVSVIVCVLDGKMYGNIVGTRF